MGLELIGLGKKMQKLYDLGCRRMTVSGLLPLGCMPVVMTINSPLRRTCLEKVNSDAQIYNAKLVKLLSELQQKLPGSILAYGDSYTPLMELITNPEKHGTYVNLIKHRNCLLLKS